MYWWIPQVYMSMYIGFITKVYVETIKLQQKEKQN